jgi:predicted lipoprotein with Yx(FWY)xxD motif
MEREGTLSVGVLVGEIACTKEAIVKSVRAIVLAPVVVSVLLAAGCGSSSSSSSSSTAARSSAAPSSAASTATPVAITTKHDKLGTILAAGPKRLTVYMFGADKTGSSSCSGSCTSVWPPVTGKPTASGQAVSASLGTITRTDGTIQATYKGHPLYYFVKDKDDGDTYGQGVNGFGASWFALTPSGTQAGKSGGATPSSGGAAPKATSTGAASSSSGSGSYGY